MSRQQENLGGDFAYEALPRSVPSQCSIWRVMYEGEPSPISGSLHMKSACFWKRTASCEDP